MTAEPEIVEIRHTVRMKETDDPFMHDKAKELLRESLLRQGCHDIRIVEESWEPWEPGVLAYIAVGKQGPGARNLLDQLAKQGEMLNRLIALGSGGE